MRTAAHYAQGMKRVLDHIHTHLDDDLDLLKLADIACLSAHHWHRVYHATQGETAAATVKRLRLQRAAGLLAQTDWPIARIAQHSGYPNLQSFTRTFKATHGMPPARYRAEGPHAAFADAARPGEAPDAAATFAVRLVDQPALDLAVVHHTGSYMEIGQAFGQLYGQLNAMGLPSRSLRSLALYFDDADAIPTERLRSCAGVVIDADEGHCPGTLTPMRIAASPCAVLRYQGPYASMHAAYRWFFGHWLVHSGHEPADAPVVEEYLNNPRDTPPLSLLTDIWMPLKNTGEPAQPSASAA